MVVYHACLYPEKQPEPGLYSGVLYAEQYATVCGIIGYYSLSGYYPEASIFIGEMILERTPGILDQRYLYPAKCFGWRFDRNSVLFIPVGKFIRNTFDGRKCTGS